MTRSLAQKYYPNPTPLEASDWPRYLDSELTRIADRFNQPPVYAAIKGNEFFPIAVAPFTITLGTEGITEENDPFGTFDGTTGEFTCPQTGIWQLSSSAFIDSFGAGNKTYEAKLELLVDAVVTATMIAGGADDVALGISLPFQFRADQGELLTLDLTASHENQTGNPAYFYSFSYLRIGDI